jgi:outer membrane usher protein
MRAPPTLLPTRSRIRRAACLLVAGAAGCAGAAAGEPGDFEFDGALLRNAGSAPIDVSRFTRGNAALPGNYSAELHVNQAWLGRIEVSLRQVGTDALDVQPCVDRALLERTGVDFGRLAPAASARLDEASRTCVLLANVVEGATATFDAGEQRLDVSLPQASMTRQPRGYVAPRFWDEGVDAALLEYHAHVFRNQGPDQAFTSGYLGLQTGINFGAWRLRHRGSFTHESRTGNRYQAIQTSVQRSLVPLKSQLVLGDAFTDGAVFDSFAFRGIQLASDDRMHPESQRGYAPVVRGIARSNARVQIRQRGSLLHETTVTAGPFEIDDLYPTGYAGDLEVTLTETDGSVHAWRVPYAAAVNALRSGATRYSVTAGRYRHPSGGVSGPVLLQATAQHGFSNLFTGYGGLVVSRDYAAAAAGVALNTPYGAVAADITTATAQPDGQPTRKGHSLRLSYSMILEPTRTNLTVAAYRYSTRGYLDVAGAMSQRHLDERAQALGMRAVPRGKLQFMVSQDVGRQQGGLYVSGSIQDYWDRSGRDVQLQVGYKHSHGRVSYGISLARQRDRGNGNWDNRLLLTVGTPLGDGPHAPYALTSVDRDSSGAGSVRQSIAGTFGEAHAVGYAVNMARVRDANGATHGSVGAHVSYAAPMATLRATASRGAGHTQLSAAVSGGLVAYAGGVAFAPSLGETVAVVDAPDAGGARLAGGSGLRIGPWGIGIVPNLMPFVRNEIDIDPRDLPINVELRSTMQRVSPTAGAVVRVTFETQDMGRTVIIEARQDNGEPLPFGAEVRDAAGLGVGTVAQGGRIFARGLKEDAGVLTVVLDTERDRQCSLPYRLAPREGTAPAVSMASAVCSDSAGLGASRPAPVAAVERPPR